MQFLYSAWLALDLPKRQELAAIFNLQKKGPTHVQDNRIISDGYDIKEVEMALNLDAIQKHLDTTETDMAILWEWLIKGKPEIISPVTATPPPPPLTNMSSTYPRVKTRKERGKRK